MCLSSSRTLRTAALTSQLIIICRYNKGNCKNRAFYASCKIYNAGKVCSVFTARCYVSAVLAMGLCPSVTSRCSTKTVKRRITQTTPHDTPGDSSFLMPKIYAKFDQGHPLTEAPNTGGVGQNRRLSTNNRLYLENGTR